MRLNRYPTEVICDLAEIYRIYDYKSLPVQMVATFVCGLKADSRTAMAEQGLTGINTQLLLASISDALRWLQWQMSDDAKTSGTAPLWFVDAMMGKTSDGSDSDVMTFDSAESFEEYRKQLIEKG